MFKPKFIRFLACSLIMAGSLYPFMHSANARSPKSMPLPEGSYQLARSVFLPEASEDTWFSHYDRLPNDYNQDPCKKMGYPIKDDCPKHGNCSKCPADSNFLKLNSCSADGSQKYRISPNGLKCEPYCDYKGCDMSQYPMMTCPEGTACETCTQVNNDCTSKFWYKTTTNCISGYCYIGGRCQKVKTEDCEASYGPAPEWRDDCPEGYICSEAGTYMTSDCKTGTCWKFKSCDNSKDYYLVSSSTGTPRCKHMPCYKTQKNCNDFKLTSCPANGTCEKCTETDQYCNEGDTKYNLIGCKKGYHLDYNKTKCIKDCVIGDEASNPDLMFVDPSYVTLDECKAQDGVSSCMQYYFYTNTFCAMAPKFIPNACKSGYKLKQETSQKNGGTLLKITCAKDVPQCTIKTCSDYKLTSCPEHADCSTCKETDSTCATTTKYQISDCDKGYLPNNLEDPYILNDENVDVDVDFSQTTSCTKFFKECDTVGDVLYFPEDNGQALCALDPNRPIIWFRPWAIVIDPDERVALSFYFSLNETYASAEEKVIKHRDDKFPIRIPFKEHLQVIADNISIINGRLEALMTLDRDIGAEPLPISSYYKYLSDTYYLTSDAKLHVWAVDLNDKTWSTLDINTGRGHVAYIYFY